MSAALRTDTGLLVLRLVVGVTFLLHGLDKLDGLGGVEMYFDSLAIPAPGFMATLVALTETVGGILLIVGLLTPVAGLALAIDMLVAALTAHADKGFFADKGGYEFVLVLGTACVALLAAGAGRFSADALALRGRQRPAWLRTIAQQ
jgi:putative oxidoreductase